VERRSRLMTNEVVASIRDRTENAENNKKQQQQE